MFQTYHVINNLGVSILDRIYPQKSLKCYPVFDQCLCIYNASYSKKNLYSIYRIPECQNR